MKSLRFAVGSLQKLAADGCQLPTANFLSFILQPSSLALCVALLPPGTALAQITTDPTRPPAEIAVEVPQGAVVNQLQSVMISPTRKAAIINGVVVELGGKYGEAVLMGVAEDQVVLRSGDSRQVLKLHPAVEKKVDVARAEPVTPVAEKSAPRKATAKAKSKTKPKSKSKPKAKTKAKTQPGAKPAADSSAETR
jgi:MSHA biogenesis protein MshK